MELSIISIGNSKGIRLPKTILDKYNLVDKLEVFLEKDAIILKPSTIPRRGWAEAFKRMNKNKDDQSLLPDIFDDESLLEWN
jgi:antitoxin MazE